MKEFLNLFLLAGSGLFWHHHS